MTERSLPQRADGTDDRAGPDEVVSPRIAENRARQRELYGAPLGDRVRSLTAALGITQARLARTLGVSPAMLSQLVSGRRVKIGDPAVLARLLLIDHRCSHPVHPLTPSRVEELLCEAARAHWDWAPVSGVPVPRPRTGGLLRPTPPRPPPPLTGQSAADALRRLAPPARLVAAAAALGPGFPELAEVLRQAARRPG